MPSELRLFSDGVFTLSETENENQLYFYRNDGTVLDDVGEAPMDFYQNYIIMKMMEGEITDVVMNDICFEESDDGKCIRLTISGVDNSRPSTNAKEINGEKSKGNFFKNIFKKIFS
jgi:hypothetical protein